jgi:nucleoside recognition membrane protein YjiH
VLAGLSVTPLIFFAETGVLILRSAIPLNTLQLIGIFLLGTVIAPPIPALVAHLVV